VLMTCPPLTHFNGESCRLGSVGDASHTPVIIGPVKGFFPPSVLSLENGATNPQYRVLQAMCGITAHRPPLVGWLVKGRRYALPFAIPPAYNAAMLATLLGAFAPLSPGRRLRSCPDAQPHRCVRTSEVGLRQNASSCVLPPFRPEARAVGVVRAWCPEAGRAVVCTQRKEAG
jgi:hypothetical protein